MKARYYDGGVGRFLAQDPASRDNPNQFFTDPQQLNSYSYVRNNPQKYVDPSGEFLLDFFEWLFTPNTAYAPGPDTDLESLPDSSAYSGEDAAWNIGFTMIPGIWGSVRHADEARHIIPDDRAKHMFGDRPGHLPDTPENRKSLQDIADDPKTTLGPDKHGTNWSAKTNPDGTQTWVRTKDGTIINGGVNETPRTYNPETGLNAPKSPND